MALSPTSTVSALTLDKSSLPPKIAPTQISAEGSFGGKSMKNVPSTLEKLKEESPEMYKKMMEGIAWNICSKIKDHSDRLMEMMREERRKNGG